MKILYHHRIASKDGQYVHIEEIIHSLQKLGCRVEVVAPRIAEQSQFGSSGGWVAHLKQRLPRFIYELMEFSYSFWAFIKLWRAIRAHRPDLIYERYNLLFPAGIWAKKWFKLPLLLEVNAPLFEERSRYDGISLKALARWSEGYTWRGADLTLPVTEVLADYLRQAGVPAERIDVIANGINVEVFLESPPPPPPPALSALQLDDKVVIGFTGFCREWHGLDKVLEIMHATDNPSLFFLVVGDGPASAMLTAKAAQLGLQERFCITGVVPRDEIAAWLEPITIALQPAVVAYASPLKMIEYMAKGKAIVAPNTPNIRELLRDGENALLFHPDDIDSFTLKIRTLCEQPALRERLGRAAHAEVVQRPLTWDNNAKRIIAHATALAAQPGVANTGPVL